MAIRNSDAPVGESLAPGHSNTDSFRILKTNRDEYLILLDNGEDFEALYREWCSLDDAFCEGELPENKWMDIAAFLRNKQVIIIEPFEIQTLADYY